jgi:hypothetical protein
MTIRSVHTRRQTVTGEDGDGHGGARRARCGGAPVACRRGARCAHEGSLAAATAARVEGATEFEEADAAGAVGSRRAAVDQAAA